MHRQVSQIPSASAEGTLLCFDFVIAFATFSAELK